MANGKKKKDKKQSAGETIFDEKKAQAKGAKSVLELARKQEVQKIKEGFGFVLLADKKTRVLRKLQ